MINRIIECVCDYCGNAEYYDSWKTAANHGWRKLGKGNHFCSSQHKVLFATGSKS